MSCIDSAGNLIWTDPTQGQTAANWQAFHRQQAALAHLKVPVTAPATALPSGGEKAERGHD